MLNNTSNLANISNTPLNKCDSVESLLLSRVNFDLRTSRLPAMMIATILGAAKAATLDNDSPDVLRQGYSFIRAKDDEGVEQQIELLQSMKCNRL